MMDLNKLLQSAKELMKSGNEIEAAKIYNQIFVQQPNNYDVAETLALIFVRQKKYDTAEKIFQHILTLWPNSASTHGNLGNIYLVRNESKKAIEHIKKAVELEPEKNVYKKNLAKAYTMSGEYESAIKVLDQVEKTDPDDFEVIESLANLYNINNPSGLEKYIKKMAKLRPSIENNISEKTYVPSYFNSQEEIDKYRDQLSKNMDELLASNPKLDDLSRRVFVNIFYLTYHNRNNRELKSKFAQIFQQAAPQLNFTAPHCNNYKRDKSKKIKLGFASAFFLKHPVSICFSGLIEEMIKDERFEVDILFFAGTTYMGRKDFNTDPYYSKLKNAHKVYIYDTDFIKTRDHIASLQLDAIIYLDLGMYWMANYTAFTRLAPIQAMMSGHPDTSGIKNMDYYLTCKDLEMDNADEYYSEKLVRFKNVPTCISKPDLPEKFKSRKELGLPEDKKIYYCPMKNHKFHPDFDLALKDILEGDKNSVILVPKDSGESSDMIEKRIEKHLGETLKGRIIYHRWAEYSEFLSYLREADVVLDTFYFGAGTTLYFAFAVDAPVVTLPGLLGGGRAANAIYKQMGVTDLIAKDKADYTRLAIKCANDSEFRNSVKQKINSHKEIIYNNTSITPEILNFIAEKLKAYE